MYYVYALIFMLFVPLGAMESISNNNVTSQRIKVLAQDVSYYVHKNDLEKSDVIKNMLDFEPAYTESPTNTLDLTGYDNDKIKILVKLLTGKDDDLVWDGLERLIKKAHVADEFNISCLKEICKKIANVTSYEPLEVFFEHHLPGGTNVDFLVSKNMLKIHSDVIQKTYTKIKNEVDFCQTNFVSSYN